MPINLLVEKFFAAAQAGDFETVRQLILNEGVKPESINARGKSLLNLFTACDILYPIGEGKVKQAIIHFCLEHGALNNSHNIAALKNAITSCEHLNNVATHKIYAAIVHYALSLSPDLFTVDIKRLATLCALRLKDYDTLEQLASKPSPHEARVVEQIARSIYTECEANEIKYEDTITTLAKNEIYRSVFLNIGSLLQNTPLCVALLKELDNALGAQYRELEVDLSPCLRDARHYVFINHPWPILDDVVSSVKTYGRLPALLLEKERKHGLNIAHNAPATLSNYIDENVATDLLSAGNIFNEFSYSSLITHGKYSHRLQWYIILTAIERGYLSTHGISARTLLSELIPLWNDLLDCYQSHTQDTSKPLSRGFSSPFYLHSSLLLATHALPFLCGTLRKTFTRSLRISSEKHAQLTTPTRLCAEMDALASSIDTSLCTISVKEYYRAKEKENKIEILYQDRRGGLVFFKQRGHAPSRSSKETSPRYAPY